MIPLKRVLNDVLETHAPKTWLNLNILRRNRNFGPEYWLLPKLCRKDALAVDVGGNRGRFAYYMARCAREVHVFEPNPICLAQISRLKTRNMMVHKVALSDNEGMATIRFDPKNTGVGTIESTNTLADNPGIREVVELDVPVRTLDSFRLTNVGLIKVDVEGHEAAVLRGAKALLAAERPTLLVELERRHNPTVFETVSALLDPLGYRVKACTRSGLLPIEWGEIGHLQEGDPHTSRDYIHNFVLVAS